MWSSNFASLFLFFMASLTIPFTVKLFFLKNHILLVLLSLEYFSLINIFMVVALSTNLTFISFTFLVVIIMAVAEASVALSLLVMSARLFNKEGLNVSTFKLNKL